MKRTVMMVFWMLVATGPPAEAQSVREFLNFCTTGSIRTCASTRVETLWDPANGVTRVNLLIRNLQGWLQWDNSGGSALTRVAITSPTLINARGLSVNTAGTATAVGTPNAFWAIRNWPLEGTTQFLAMTSQGTNPGPVEGGIFGCWGLTMVSPINYFRTCGDAGWVNFSFITTGQWDAVNSQIGWAVVKTNADGSAHICRSDDPIGCGVPPVTTTPEPASALLLGSGLAGLAALKRRRQQRKEAALA